MPKAKLLPSNLWDEIVSRHQREQEEFIRMEEQKLGTGLKRSSSLETIRETVKTSLSLESGSESSGFMTDASSSSSASSASHKRIKLCSNSSPARPAPLSYLSSSESGFESEWDMGSTIDADDGDFFSDNSIGIHDPRPQSASSTWDVL